MIYSILFLVAIIASFVYEKINYSTHIKELLISYSLTFKFIKGEEDSNNLIHLTLQQIKLIALILFKVLIVIAPFFIILSIAYLLNFNIVLLILSFKVNLAIISGFIFYYLLKKYAKK